MSLRITECNDPSTRSFHLIKNFIKVKLKLQVYTCTVKKLTRKVILLSYSSKLSLRHNAKSMFSIVRH